MFVHSAKNKRISFLGLPPSFVLCIRVQICCQVMKICLIFYRRCNLIECQYVRHNYSPLFLKYA